MRILLPLVLLSLGLAQEARVEIELDDGTVLRGTLPDYGTRTFRLELEGGGFVLISEDAIRGLRVIPEGPTLAATITPAPDGFRLAFTATGLNSLSVFRGLAGSSRDEPLAILPGDATELFDAAVLPGFAYRYRVRSAALSVELQPAPLPLGPTVFLPAALKALIPPELDDETRDARLWALKRTLLTAPDASLVGRSPDGERRVGLHPWLDAQLGSAPAQAWIRAALEDILAVWEPEQGLDDLRALWLLDPGAVTLDTLLDAVPAALHPALLARAGGTSPRHLWFHALLRGGRAREAAHVLAEGGALAGAPRAEDRQEHAFETGPVERARWGGRAYAVDDEGWLRCRDAISGALLWAVRPARRALDDPALAPEPLRLFVQPREDAPALVVWAARGTIYTCDAGTGALLAAADACAEPGVETVALVPGPNLPEEAALAVFADGLEILTLPGLERVTLPLPLDAGTGPFALQPVLRGTILQMRKEDGREAFWRVSWEELDGRPRYALEPLRVCTVEVGDSLHSLAREHLGEGQRWREIQRLNPEVMQGLRPGMRLVLPLD